MKTGVQEETIRALRARLEVYKDGRARWAGWSRRFVPTGLASLDGVLPHGGVPCGAVTEILTGAGGTGAMTLAMRIAQKAREDGLFRAGDESKQTGRERAIILIDTIGDFYPPAVAAFGIDPEQLIVIRTSSRRDAFWAMDQAMRCGGVGVVVASLSGLDERQSRRLQLAAEVSGGIGLLLSPSAQTRVAKSFAAVRMLVQTFVEAPRPGPVRRCFLVSINLLAVREGMPTGPVLVDLHHATGACAVHSLPGDRTAVRTG